MYDRYVKVPNDSVIIQSLLGRATGYNHNNSIIIFTNISSITKYNLLLKSEFNDINVNWSSNSTTKINGELIGKNTFNSVSNFNEKVNKMNLHDYFDIPVYISISKKEMDNILNTKPYNYDQSKIFSIIKSYNNDLYHKLINTVKNTYETPKKNYKRLILDNVIKSDNKIKSNFYRTIISTKNNKEKQDYHNIFFDNKLNRIVVEFFYYSKMNDE